MNKIISLMKKNWAYLIGGIAGSIGGYFYWYYVGCSMQYGNMSYNCISCDEHNMGSTFWWYSI